MSWLTDKIKLYAACGLAAALFAAVILVGSYWIGAKMALGKEVKAHAATTKVLGKTQADLKQSQADLQTCHGNVDRLDAAVDAQNKAVEAWKQAALDQERRAAEAVQRARTQAARLRAEGLDIARAEPAPGEDRCKAAELLLRGTLGAQP